MEKIDSLLRSYGMSILGECRLSEIKEELREYAEENTFLKRNPKEVDYQLFSIVGSIVDKTQIENTDYFLKVLSGFSSVNEFPGWAVKLFDLRRDNNENELRLEFMTKFNFRIRDVLNAMSNKEKQEVLEFFQDLKFQSLFLEIKDEVIIEHLRKYAESLADQMNGDNLLLNFQQELLETLKVEYKQLV